MFLLSRKDHYMSIVKAAIIGPGNIGTDLMYKLIKSPVLEMVCMAGIIESEGIKRAKRLGFSTTVNGIKPILDDSEIKIVFDATSASAHREYVPLLMEAGKIVIDLTPAATGPYVIPCVNLEIAAAGASDLNMVTCGGQATIPIAFAINRVADSEYTEIVSCISSKSAGPGTRANIDEFTETTARALEVVAGADKGKAIIILNPAEPPIMMTNTIYSIVKNPDRELIETSVADVVNQVRKYIPGYKLRIPPIIEGNKVTVIVEVRRAGDFLTEYAGNLDIINSAAIAAAESIAKDRFV